MSGSIERHVAVVACLFISLVCAPATLCAQGVNATLPEFKDYPVTEKFGGKPAAPILVRPSDRMFRTRIREGAAKGPNFAGHYTIAEWGCGAGCVSIALVDAKDGRIHPPPFESLGWGLNLKYDGNHTSDDQGFYPLAYSLDSRLFVVRGCPEGENCASYFYEWTGSHFKLIRKIVAVPVSRH